jgi:hypothetical protein
MIFNRLARKTIHEQKVHTNVGQTFACECGKKFKSYCGLYYHRKNIHSTEDFLCEHCNEVFPSTIKLKHHFIKKHKPKDTCEICGKLTESISKHTNAVHKGRLKCTFEGCDKDFAGKGSLYAHVESTHKIQEGLKCETCDAEFNSEYRLKIHILRQHQTLPKPCQVPGCKHTTTRTAYLVMHYKNHKGVDSNEKVRLISELKKKAD